MTHLVPVLALSLMAGGAAPEPEDARLNVLQAMKAELDRSMQRLKLEGYDAPYFISYQVKDLEQRLVSGRYGAVFEDAEARDRNLAVDVRVGSYEFDSSGGDPMEMMDFSQLAGYQPRKDGPLEDDPRALRNALGLLTDERYKYALSAFLKKKSKHVYEVADKERTTSFSKEEPSRFVQPVVPHTFEREQARRLVREVGALFKAFPELFDSDVKVRATKTVRYFVSSEGSAILTEEVIYGVHVQGVARADDGQLLENGRDWYALSQAQLPPVDEVKRQTLEMIEELRKLRRAPALDPYTGPAILEPEATGVLFHEVVGHRLEGDRQEDDKEGRTFKGQIGQRVLPEHLSVVDDPTLEKLAERTLNGFYRYDEEGVPAQKVSLIEDGVLKAFLLSRRPVKGFVRSNGHGRSQGNRPPIARMGNLLVQSKRKVSDQKLKQMLLEEARRQHKPYALIIRDISGGNTNTSSYGYQAFKGIPRLVYRVDAKTGKEELVRGVEMVGTPLTTINKITATGDTLGVFNGFCGAESGYIPVSAVAPAALITELELQRTGQMNERAPLLPSPWAVEHDEAPKKP